MDIFNPQTNIIPYDPEASKIIKNNVFKLLVFQSFFLVNNIGKNIILETNDKEELDFFFKIYQHIIFDIVKFLSIPIKKKIIPKSYFDKINKRDMFTLYNYIMDFIPAKKNYYNNLF